MRPAQSQLHPKITRDEGHEEREARALRDDAHHRGLIAGVAAQWLAHGGIHASRDAARVCSVILREVGEVSLERSGRSCFFCRLLFQDHGSSRGSEVVESFPPAKTLLSGRLANIGFEWSTGGREGGPVGGRGRPAVGHESPPRTKDDKKGKNAGAGADAGARTTEPAPPRSIINPRGGGTTMRCPAASAWTPSCTAHRARCRGSPRASKPTPPSSPPRMFPAPGQATGPGAATTAPWGALDVNNGAPHPGRSAIATQRVQRRAPRRVATRPRVVHACRRPAFVRERLLAGREDAAGSRGPSAKEPRRSARDSSSRTKPLKRSMRIPSTEGPGRRARGSADAEAKPRGADGVATAGRATEESRAAALRRRSAPGTTATGAAKSAGDLWAAAGAAAGVTDAAVASAVQETIAAADGVQEDEADRGDTVEEGQGGGQGGEGGGGGAGELSRHAQDSPGARGRRPDAPVAAREERGVPETRYQSALAQISRTADRRRRKERPRRPRERAGAGGGASVGRRRSTRRHRRRPGERRRVHQRDVGPRAGG